MENKLLVFVSSVMQKKNEDLSLERKIVKKAVEEIQLATPWLFEYTPASSTKVNTTYLTKVIECDIFIMLLGSEITDPVRKEYMIAIKYNKPKIIFLKDNVRRSDDVTYFINKIEVKWKRFFNPQNLYDEVKTAIIDELIKSYREFHLTMAELKKVKIKPTNIKITRDKKILRSHPKAKKKKKLTVDNIIPMKEYLIDNIVNQEEGD